MGQQYYVSNPSGGTTPTQSAYPVIQNELLNLGKPVKETEITESGKGNGVKIPSATAATVVSIYFKMTEDKAASMKVEIGGVIVYEESQSAVAALKQTTTAGPFIVPKGLTLKVTFSECTGIIPVYQTASA